MGTQLSLCGRQRIIIKRNKIRVCGGECFDNLTQARVTLEQGTQLGKRINQTTYRQVCGTFSWLIIGVRGPSHCGRCHLWAGGAGSGKKAEQTMGEEVSLWPVLQFLPPGSCSDSQPLLSSKMDRNLTFPSPGCL